ncbi:MULTISPECIES: MAPEG family protein [Shewanella]|uniref:MAPEG family protein n=1 Tax=Shewanella TaxID=22 RepID=UPI00048D6F39|nr:MULTISPECIES: MAPEG family protein [Shewanella]QLE83950.1 MAPEG family protein [Shewanella sp. Scap07]
MTFAISGLYISLTAILVVVLAMRVVKLRRLHKVGIGTADNRALELACRVHGNLVENAPFVLLLMVVAESQGLAPLWLHIVGISWIVARLLHAMGLTQGNGGYHYGRFMGGLISWLLVLTLSVVNIIFFAFSAFS